MLVRLQKQLSAGWFTQIIFWLIPVLSVFFIFQIFALKTSSSGFVEIINSLFIQRNFISILLFISILTFLNVFVEAIKWKESLRPNIELNYLESMQQTLMAMAAGFVTPFKSGAVFSRIISNEESEKTRLIQSMIHMAMAQFCVTFMFGIFSLTYTLWYFNGIEWAFWILIGSIISSAVIFYLFSANVNFKFKKIESLVFSFRKEIMIWSVIRYGVFTLQYFIILQFCGVESETILLFSLIGITYLINSLIPAGILGKIGVRELSGILIIGETTGFVMETAVAAFIIWGFNQAIPAIFGSYFFIQRNLREAR